MHLPWPGGGPKGQKWGHLDTPSQAQAPGRPQPRLPRTWRHPGSLPCPLFLTSLKRSLCPSLPTPSCRVDRGLLAAPTVSPLAPPPGRPLDPWPQALPRPNHESRGPPSPGLVQPHVPRVLSMWGASYKILGFPQNSCMTSACLSRCAPTSGRAPIPQGHPGSPCSDPSPHPQLGAGLVGLPLLEPEPATPPPAPLPQSPPSSSQACPTQASAQAPNLL